jgi:hypothetical protein
MGRTVIPAQLSGAPYESALTATTWTACDAVNFNSTPLSGNQVLIFWNTHASTTYHVTVHSSGDVEGRTEDITTFAIPAGTTAHTSKYPIIGWQDSGGSLDFDADNASIKVAVLTIV